MSSEKLTEQLQHNAESIAKQLDAIEAQIAALELHNQQSKQIQNHASTNVNQNQSTNHSQTQANNSPNTITKTPSASQNAPASGSLDSMHHLHPQVMERKSSNICVFGAGSFGTSLAFVLAKNGHNITILARKEEIVKSINEKHVNPEYFTSFTLPHNVKASSDPHIALKNVDYIVHSIPVQNTPLFLSSIKHIIPKDTPIISCSKGIHAQTLEYMLHIIPSALENPKQPLAFFSGPSFAKELMQEVPTGVVVASENVELGRAVQHLFLSTRLRVYLSTDVIGVEVGGALKNVFAIAAGIAEGLGLGLNSQAALVTRGCSEMTRLARAMGARAETLSGLAGIGDLMLTCYGALSRNRTVGKRLGQGESIVEIQKSMKEVAEGVATAPAALALAKKYNLDLPIVSAVAAILDGKLSAKNALIQLMMLPVDQEISF